jgi:protein-tyrosine phosphatase
MLKSYEVQELQQWGSTTPCGTVIEGTNILPIKAPIGLLFELASRSGHLHPSARWDRWTVEKTVKDMGYAGIHAVINLCNTTKYMKKWRWNENVEYRHFATKGFATGEEPDFAEPIDFLQRMHPVAEKNHTLIIVHCTHGKHRTGALCCEFLVTQRGLTRSAATENFTKARESVEGPEEKSTESPQCLPLMTEGDSRYHSPRITGGNKRKRELAEMHIQTPQ